METQGARVQALRVAARPYPMRIAVTIVLLASLVAPGARADAITLVSANPTGTAADAPSAAIAMARDGTVLFESGASDLVALPARGGTQVYAWRDGTVRLVSRAIDGGRSNGTSRALAISANGRKVAFTSTAPDALGLGTNPGGHAQLFVADLVDDSIVLVSHALGAPTRGGNGPITLAMLSEDGSVVAFQGSPSDVSPRLAAGENVYAWNGSTEPELVSMNSAGLGGLNDSYLKGMSADGRHILFETTGANIVQGVVDFNGSFDGFLRDRSAQSTRLVTHRRDDPTTASTNGARTVAVSADGRSVLLDSFSEFLAGVGGNSENTYVWSRVSDVYTLVSHRWDDYSTSAGSLSRAIALSADGATVLFRSYSTNLVASVDDNAQEDLFVWRAGVGSAVVTRRADGSATSWGYFASGSLSEDGKTVAFYSRAADQNWATDDANNAWDAFAYDVATGDVRTLSVAHGQNRTGKAQSQPRAVLADGSVLMDSRAGDLAPADVNNANDVFVYRRSALLSDGFE